MGLPERIPANRPGLKTRDDDVADTGKRDRIKAPRRGQAHDPGKKKETGEPDSRHGQPWWVPDGHGTPSRLARKITGPEILFQA